MVAADQAVDSLQRLQEFEELFKNRYTESDKDYKKATQEGQRLTNVPVMSPWPPPKIYNNRRGRFRGGRDRSRRNDRGGNTHFHRRDHSNHSHHLRMNDQQSYTDPPTHSRNTDPVIDNDQRDEPLQQSPISHCVEPKALPLDSFKPSPAKPPTDSDVQAILFTAGSTNTFKSENLKKEQSRKTKKANTKISKHNLSNNTKPSSDTSNPFHSFKVPLKSSRGGDMSHGGQTESMTASLLLSEFDKPNSLSKPQRHKRKHTVLEEDKDDSEIEHIDVESDYVQPQIAISDPLTVKRPFYASSVHESFETSPLVVRLPLDHLKWRTGEGGLEHIGPLNTFTNCSENIQEAKKSKKRKKHKRKKSKETTKKPLTLKISI